MSIYGGLSEGDVLKGTVSGGQSLSGSADKINVIKGESAYEIALLNGFKGTQAEWLESLKGEDGKTPYIQNGYWYIDGINLGVRAEGTQGDPGKPGSPGTPVTITRITESSESGGTNIVEFSDGSRLNVRNGKDGEGGGGGVIEETDPTVPSWAKEDTKPKYTASEVGAIPANTPTDQVAIFGTDYHRVKIGDGDITFTGQGNEGVYVYCENGDGTLVFYGLSGDQAVRLENIATPINNGDAANKKYVDGKVTKIGVGLGNVDNVRQYSASNPPPYPVTSVNGKTGAVTVSVPTQTSQLNNNSGYITKAVSDLANYYLKSETLTKTEINALVSAIPKFTISVVTSLPTSNISETTVYLVKSGTDSDLYTEYIYVNGVWEILGSQRVDLTGYALKEDIPTKLSELDNDSGYITKAVSDLVNYYKKSEVYSKDEIDKKGFLTEHQDISGKLDASKLPEAVNSALAQAKESGEFDGEDGKSAYEYAKDGGYTGTEEEFAAKMAFLMGYSVYGYVDADNNIIIKGNIADGSYIKYEMEDGTTIDIGQLVLDNNVYYSVTSNLTNCTNSNSETQAIGGESYSATITANSGYELSSVVVTMGGTDVSDSVVSGGVISIASVTGDIVITAVAEEIVVEIINQIPISIDSSGAVYNGIGYKQNVRLKSDGVTEDTVSANTDLTGYIPAVVGNEVYIKDMVLTPTETTGGQYLTTMRLYDASFTMLKAFSYGNTFNPTEENGVYKYTVPSDYPNTTYIRMQAQTINDASVITVNQPIT